MTPNEITPAQRELLRMASQADAGDLYDSLNITLALSIGNYCSSSEEREDPAARPTVKAMDAWAVTLELLRVLHAVEVEATLVRV